MAYFWSWSVSNLCDRILIGLTDFIPFIGPFIGAIPVIIFALSISWNKVIVVVIILGILQAIEGNFLQPFIIGRNLDMHPLFIMILMMLAGSFFGLMGIFFAIPVFLVVRTLAQYMIQLKGKRRNKNSGVEDSGGFCNYFVIIVLK